ncbi:hypothetical protein F5876DRAFT_69150 [Lentinula aff. lateritia]|uniref:Uncharacterized protein n=1 Tax=Lentinula aff. lateritia TaxID=2804960 RepID=A0ACC1TNB1_9AGAR|nr:hypothetical protein F5876DRAFT_69150 [Lentinula aff. lateritia]
MRMNTIYVVLGLLANAAVYGAPLDMNLGNSLGVTNLDAATERHNETMRSVSHIQMRRSVSVQAVSIKFADIHAALPDTWPPTPKRVETVITGLLKEWLHKHDRPTAIKLVFENVLQSNFEKPYSFLIGKEVWPEKCQGAPMCEGSLLRGNTWLIEKAGEELYTSTTRNLLPPYYNHNDNGGDVGRLHI